MNNMMQYKDYFGSIHYSDEDQIFYGKVEYIRSLISFEGEDVPSLRANFEMAIDDYLAFCKDKGITPEKPFKGTFNVRVGIWTDTIHTVERIEEQRGQKFYYLKDRPRPVLRHEILLIST